MAQSPVCDSLKWHAYRVNIAVSRGEVSPDSLLLVTGRPERCKPPESVYLRFYRVYALRRLERHQDALTASDSLMRFLVYFSDDNKARLFAWRARSLYQLGRFEESLHPLRLALAYYDRICPGDACPYRVWANLLMNQAWSHAETGAYQDAACGFERAGRMITAAVQDSTRNAYLTDLYTETLRGKLRLSERAGRVVVCPSGQGAAVGEWALWFAGLVGLALLFYSAINRKNS